MREILSRHAFSITFLTILFVYIFFFTGGDSGITRVSGQTMGTSYALQLVELPADVETEQLQAEIDSLLTRLDREIFSTYAPNSELSRLNDHPTGVPFIASSEMIEVLQLAREVSDLSGGAFDVTVGPMVNLWGFGPQGVPGLLPSDAEIEAALEQVGFRHLRIDASNFQVIKTRDLYIDLSAIAKGYAVDQLAAYLADMGIESYFLEIGGELRIRGLKPGEESWVPAIEAPQDGSPQIYEIFYSRGDEIAVAGSGDYRNYFEQDGVRYSHEIDPRSGRPVSHNLAAVYVIADTTAYADAMATAYMILGLEEGAELAQELGQAVYFIYKSGDNSGQNQFSDLVTPQFSNYLANQ